jgi:uncharacterized protein (DUF1501 family)
VARLFTSLSRRCSRAHRHDTNHVLDDAGLDVYNSGFLAEGGESAGRLPRFLRALTSAVAVATAGAFLLPALFGAARGEVVVSPASASAAASAAAFLSAASRCLANPMRSGALTLKNSNTRFVRDPLSSAAVSLYSFGDTGLRMKSPWAFHLPSLQHCKSALSNSQ